MPKIPTFTATGRPTAEVGAVKSNIQIPLTQTIGTALAPVTKAVTDYAIKQKEVSQKLEANKVFFEIKDQVSLIQDELKNDFDESNSVNTFNQQFKSISETKLNSITNRGVKSLLQNKLDLEYPEFVSKVKTNSRDALEKQIKFDHDTTQNILSSEYIFANAKQKTIILDKAIVQADGWVETSIGVLDTSLKTTIWIEEQQEWEEFQGRFFVKILSDIVTDEYLESQIGTIISSTLEARTKLFYISDQTATNDGSASGIGINGSGLFQGLYGFGSQQSNTPNVKNQSLSDTKGEWADENLEFDNGQTSEGWFIDHAFSAAQQPTILSDTSGWLNHDSGANIYDASVSGNLRKSESQKVNGMTGVVVTDDYYTKESSGAFMWIKQFGNGQVRTGAGSSFSNYKDTNVYGSENGKYYMHLSFSGVGEHLAPNGPTITQGSYSNGRSNFSKFTLHHIHNHNQQNDTAALPYNHSDKTQDSSIVPDPNRSEERRVGKECRSRWSPDHYKKKKNNNNKKKNNKKANDST